MGKITLDEAQETVKKKAPAYCGFKAYSAIRDAIKNGYRLCRTDDVIEKLQTELDDMRLASDMRYSDYSYYHDLIAKTVEEATK